MNLHFDKSLAQNYKSNSQKIRVMSESWVETNMYCPCCGNTHLFGLDNNKPVADFQCDNCGEIFELKSKEGNLGRKIADGAYYTMLDRITSTTNPDLLVLQYCGFDVVNFMIVPKFFFVPAIIEKRKPLGACAKRAGWIGCNIKFSDIPKQGKINIIKNKVVLPPNNVISEYRHIKKLQTYNIQNRGWLMDVLNCVNEINSVDFYLKDLYEYTETLQKKHMNNNNIEAKIRQQLQILRDKGFIEFLERGHYRKIY